MRTIVVTDRDIGVRESIVKAVYFHGRIYVQEGYDAVARCIRSQHIDVAFAGDHHGRKTDVVVDMYRLAQTHGKKSIRVLVSDQSPLTTPSIVFALREGVIHHVVPYPKPGEELKAFLDGILPDEDPTGEKAKTEK